MGSIFIYRNWIFDYIKDGGCFLAKGKTDDYWKNLLRKVGTNSAANTQSFVAPKIPEEVCYFGKNVLANMATAAFVGIPSYPLWQ